MHQWSQMAKRRDEWGFPLKPSPEDAAMFQNQLGVHDRTLLLGATPELQHLASVVIDHNPDALAQCRGGVLADWSDLPFAAEFDAVIGDGSLNVFQGSWGLFFQQAAKALKPLGHLVLRVFISPETKEDLQQVLAERGEIGFHAFKWKVAHAVANPYVCVKDLYRIIRPVWNHPTLEVYQNSDLVYYKLFESTLFH